VISCIGFALVPGVSRSLALEDGGVFFVREHSGSQKLVRQIHLSLPNLCAFADVQRVRHQLKVGEDFVEGGSDGAGDDVIDGEFFSCLGSALNRRRQASAEELHAFGVEASEAFSDGAIACHGGGRQLSLERSAPADRLHGCRHFGIG